MENFSSAIVDVGRMKSLNLTLIHSLACDYLRRFHFPKQVQDLF